MKSAWLWTFVAGSVVGFALAIVLLLGARADHAASIWPLDPGRDQWIRIGHEFFKLDKRYKNVSSVFSQGQFSIVFPFLEESHWDKRAELALEALYKTDVKGFREDALLLPLPRNTSGNQIRLAIDKSTQAALEMQQIILGATRGMKGYVSYQPEARGQLFMAKLTLLEFVQKHPSVRGEFTGYWDDAHVLLLEQLSNHGISASDVGRN